MLKKIFNFFHEPKSIEEIEQAKSRVEMENAVMLAFELNSYSATSESRQEEIPHAIINKLKMIFRTFNFMFDYGSFISRCKSRKFFLSTEVLEQVLY